MTCTQAPEQPTNNHLADNDDGQDTEAVIRPKSGLQKCEDKSQEVAISTRCEKISTCLLVTYQFPILILLAILLASAYPPLGAVYLQPQITATWIAVILMFLISGVGLKTPELANAFKILYFNVYVQTFNFLFVSVFVFAVSRLLKHTNAINPALADGMVICSCLPMAINVVIVLTGAAGGDEAAAIFHTTVGNIIGIFLSPVLILLYLGAAGNVSLPDVFFKLTLRVIVPLVIGQILRASSQTVAEFYTKHKRRFKRTQEYSLVFIVYTVFCKTFQDGMEATAADVALTMLFQFMLIVFFMVVAWYSLKYMGFRDKPKLRVMGFFGCMNKTIALGVPLINSMYENDPLMGLYALPLLIWHPMQLLIGSYLAPKLLKFVEEEEQSPATEKGECSTADSDQTCEEGEANHNEGQIFERSNSKTFSTTGSDEGVPDVDEEGQQDNVAPQYACEKSRKDKHYECIDTICILK